MAQKTKSPRQSFYEVVFRGKPKVVRAFLSGLVMGTGTDGTIFYSYTDGVHHEGKTEKLAEMVHIRATDCHVIIDSTVNALIKKLAKRILLETGLEVVSQGRIKGASLKLKYRTFAKPYNDEIVGMIRNLPKGLKTEGFKHDVKVDPSARGVEAYSPVHDYQSTGEATIKGRVDLVIAFKKRLVDYPLIESEDVKLQML